MFFCYTYGDVLITTMHGMNFWDCLFSGKIRDFYELNLDAELVAGQYRGQYSAGYDFFVYIIFAIWDFPLWLCKNVLGIEHPLNYPLGQLWAKSIGLLFYVLSMIVLQKFLKKINFNNGTMLILLMSTSLFVSAYIGMIGQYDIITIFFMILGIYFLVCDRELLFVLLFSIAIPTKLFALFAFVPILLLYEKRIIKIAGSVILSMVPLLIFRILIPINVGGSNTSVFLNFLFADTIPLATYKSSLFVLVYISFLFFCFWKKGSDDKSRFIKEVIYIGFLAYFIYFSFGFANPYWFIYMIPFLYLILCWNKKYFVMNLLLEICMSFFAIIAQSIQFYWVFSNNIIIGNTISKEKSGYNMVDFLKFIVGESHYDSLVDYILQICWGFFVVSGISFAILNCPWLKEKKAASKLACKENVIVLFIIRAICLLIIYAIPFLWMFV